MRYRNPETQHNQRSNSWRSELVGAISFEKSPFLATHIMEISAVVKVGGYLSREAMKRFPELLN